MLSAALSSVNRVKDAPPIPQRKVLRRAALLANVAAWTMIAAALSVLVYSITLSIQAPAVADALGGPFHSNSASISLDFMFLFMFACAVPALISARRIWRAASYS
jgi:hypothetical protein